MFLHGIVVIEVFSDAIVNDACSATDVTREITDMA